MTSIDHPRDDINQSNSNNNNNNSPPATAAVVVPHDQTRLHAQSPLPLHLQRRKKLNNYNNELQRQQQQQEEEEHSLSIAATPPPRSTTNTNNNNNELPHLSPIQSPQDDHNENDNNNSNNKNDENKNEIFMKANIKMDDMEEEDEESGDLIDEYDYRTITPLTPLSTMMITPLTPPSPLSPSSASSHVSSQQQQQQQPAPLTTFLNFVPHLSSSHSQHHHGHHDDNGMNDELDHDELDGEFLLLDDDDDDDDHDYENDDSDDVRYMHHHQQQLRLPHVHHHHHHGHHPHSHMIIRASDLERQTTDFFNERRGIGNTNGSSNRLLNEEENYEDDEEEEGYDEEDHNNIENDENNDAAANMISLRKKRRKQHKNCTSEKKGEENGENNDGNDEEMMSSLMNEQTDDDCPFEFSAKTRLQTSFLHGVIVSCWDNTMGPKPIQVWHAKPHVNTLDQELILFITRFTLIDELSREDQIALAPGGVELKFNVLNDMGIIVLTSVFIGRLYNQMLRSFTNTVYTINLIMSRSDLDQYLNMHEIMKQRVMTLTRIFQSSLQSEVNWQKPPLVSCPSHQNMSKKPAMGSSGNLLSTIGRIMPIVRSTATTPTSFDSSGGSSTSSYQLPSYYYIDNPGPQFILSQFEVRLLEFVTMFDTLFRCGLKPFGASDTIFGRDFLRMINHPASLDFVEKALTSHLETHGYSVVIGPESEIDEVNMWVNTLSCFLLPREAKLCRLATIGNKFTPELFVQGVVYNSSHPYASSIIAGNASANSQTSSDALLKFLVPSSSVLSGKFPVSVIDVHNKVVYSFTQYAFFSILKRDYFSNQTPSIHSPLRNNLSVLGNEKARPDSAHLDKIKSAFTRHHRVCYSVHLLLKDLAMCSHVDAHLRLGYVQEWIRCLNRRAITICKFIGVIEPRLLDCARLASLQSDEFQLSHAQRSNGWTMKELKRRILTLLINDLKSSRGGAMTEEMKKSELNVLMATAEKLYPGVYMLVMGNPEKGVETVVSFFEGY